MLGQGIVDATLAQASYLTPSPAHDLLTAHARTIQEVQRENDSAGIANSPLQTVFATHEDSSYMAAP
jgi:hypothetical protein